MACGPGPKRARTLDQRYTPTMGLDVVSPGRTIFLGRTLVITSRLTTSIINRAARRCGRRGNSMAGDRVLTTFQHGVWGTTTLTGKFVTIYDDAVKFTPSKVAQCGVWTLLVTDLAALIEKVEQASESIVAPDIRYNVVIQGPLPKRRAGGRRGARISPLAAETVLVTDIGSLVQLFASLDSAPVTYIELSSPKQL